MSETEYQLLTAMEALGHKTRDGFRKCAVVLMQALEAAGQMSEAAKVAICNAGDEETETKRYYSALRQLVVEGFAEGRGDLTTPAGPRYTECRITPNGRKRLPSALGA